MNTFNRVVFTLLLLAFIALAVALLLYPYDALRIAIVNLEALQQYLLYAEDAYYWYVGILTTKLVVFLVLLYLEIRRTRKKSVLIRTEGGGQARIGVDSVVHSLGYRIEELPGIRDVRPRITSYGKDVRVILDLRTSPTVNIPNVIQQIVALAHEIIEGQLGVRIRGKVEINVAHEPFPRGTLAPGVAAASPLGGDAPQQVRGERPAPELRPEAVRPQPTARPEPTAAPPLDRRVTPEENEFDLRPGDLGISKKAD